MIHEALCWWLMPIILATQEAEITRTTLQDQPWQKVGKTPSQPIQSWAQWYVPVNPAYMGSISRIVVLAGLGTNVRPYLKNI
jgi:hypothetical protein